MNLSLWLNIVIEVLTLVVGHLHSSGSPAVDQAHAALASATALKQAIEK